jgi:hypothetical protein
MRFDAPPYAQTRQPRLANQRPALWQQGLI